MTEVILIHSPMVVNKRVDGWRSAPGDEVSTYHLGLLYLAGYLEKNGVSVKILDVTAQRLTLEDIMETVGKESPSLIGISATSAGLRSAVRLCEALKKEYNVPVCLGGAHLNCDPHFIDRFPVFDFGIEGEGEKTLYDCYVKVKKGEKVKGLLHGEVVEPLDAIPFPARHLVNYKIYVREESKGSLPAAGILGSRGCPFECSFCSIPIIKHKVRYRSAKNVVDEMEAIYDSCNGRYSFVDDVLTLNKKKTIELCDEILRRGLKVQWCGMTRAEILSEDLVEKLAAAGCYDLFFGVESGNERIRDEVIEKKITNEEIRSAVELCRKYGIHTNLFLLVGFPSETMVEIEDTVNIGVEVKADMIGIHNTVPFPGTDIFRYAVKEGMMPADMIDRFVRGEGWDDKETFYEKWPLFIPKGLTYQDLTEAKKRAYRKFYLRFEWFLSRIHHWLHTPYRFKEDWSLIKVAPYALLRGKTKGSMS